MIVRKIGIEEKLPRGYMIVGKGTSHLGFDVALFPFNYLIAWWRNKRAQFKLQEWEEHMLSLLEKKREEIYQRGYDKGFEDAGKEIDKITAKIDQLEAKLKK